MMKNKKEWGKFIKFGLVGILNTVVDLIIFNLFLLLHCSPAVAKTFSYSAGTINSFLCNRNWTFQNKGDFKKQFLKFIGVNLVTLLISIILIKVLSPLIAELTLLTPYPYLSNNLANLIVIGITLILNFIGSKRIVFQ